MPNLGSTPSVSARMSDTIVQSFPIKAKEVIGRKKQATCTTCQTTDHTQLCMILDIQNAHGDRIGMTLLGRKHGKIQ